MKSNINLKNRAYSTFHLQFAICFDLANDGLVVREQIVSHKRTILAVQQ